MCHWEHNNHNAEKLNTILNFKIICCFLDLLLTLPQLHSKSKRFGILKLLVVNQIAILLHCDCPHRFDIVLFLRSN